MFNSIKFKPDKNYQIMNYIKSTLTLTLAILILSGCDTKTKEENTALKAEIMALQEENDMLAIGTFEMALDIDGYRSMLAEIDQSLAAIDAKNNKVKELTGNIAEDAYVEEDILLHVEHIHSIMANSKHKIAKMNENLEDLRQQEGVDEEVILELEIALYEAANEIMARDAVIEIMNEQLIVEEIDLSVLAEAYGEQTALTLALYDILNTAFFYIGTKQELIDAGIMEKEGGFLGLGRVKTLAANADDELFIQIAIDATDGIELVCKEAILITSHPEGSYEFSGEDDITDLLILDKAAFWDKSDFLVVEIVKE